MPYKSEAQRRYFNSPAGKAKIGKEEVEHWNEVSKGKELPEKADDSKSGFNADMHSYNNEVAKGNLDKAKSLLEAATKEFETYEDKNTKKAAKIELNNKRRTHGMKAIDKAIRICDKGEVDILFYVDIDGNKVHETFSSNAAMNSRRNELKKHGIERFKAWSHAEWVKSESEFRRLFNQIKGSL